MVPRRIQVKNAWKQQTVMEKRFVDLFKESESHQAMKERLPIMHYYANVCHVCRKYGETVNLRRCSNCKMVAYCSPEHQREHWKNHKDFCRAIGTMNKESGFVLDWKNKTDPNEESWWLFRQNLLNRLQLKLDRELELYEVGMILCPRACLVCHETDAQKLINCPNCPSTTFCTDHAGPGHKRRCDASRLFLQMETEPCNMLGLLPCTRLNAKILNNMEDVIRLYKKAHNIDETKLSLKLGLIHFSEVLTRPYTLLYALKQLSFLRRRINLHVVGADIIEARTVQYWEDILHHSESLKHLEVTLIGPNLGSQENSNTEPCKRCKAKKATILIKTIGKLYHDYANSNEFTKPDIIAGFNLGMHEIPETRDSWPQTIKKIAEQGCPYLMTSYQLREQVSDEEMINDTLNKEVEFIYSDKNPFSSLQPRRNFASEDFFFSNGYLTVYKNL